jgi:ketosteroid isomerase-like protein
MTARRTLGHVFLALAAALVACARAPHERSAMSPTLADSAAASRAFDAAYARFRQGYAQAEPALVSALYADSAYYLSPGQRIRRGRSVIHEEFAGFLGQYRQSGRPGPQVSFDIVDRGVSGDLGYDIGYYRFGNEEPSGKFIVLWKRGPDGVWRMWADGYSFVDRPRPVAAASTAADSAPVVRLDRSELARRTGTFRSISPPVEPPVTIHIELSGDTLKLRGLAPAPVTLVPLDRTRFRVVSPQGSQGPVLRYATEGDRVLGVSIQREGQTFVFVPLKG